MATNHQQQSASVIDLTNDSLNESFSSNKKDKQIVPYNGNKSVTAMGLILLTYPVESVIQLSHESNLIKLYLFHKTISVIPI